MVITVITVITLNAQEMYDDKLYKWHRCYGLSRIISFHITTVIHDIENYISVGSD